MSSRPFHLRLEIDAPRGLLLAGGGGGAPDMASASPSVAPVLDPPHQDRDTPHQDPDTPRQDLNNQNQINIQQQDPQTQPYNHRQNQVRAHFVPDDVAIYHTTMAMVRQCVGTRGYLHRSMVATRVTWSVRFPPMSSTPATPGTITRNDQQSSSMDPPSLPSPAPTLPPVDSWAARRTAKKARKQEAKQRMLQQWATRYPSMAESQDSAAIQQYSASTIAAAGATTRSHLRWDDAGQCRNQVVTGWSDSMTDTTKIPSQWDNAPSQQSNGWDEVPVSQESNEWDKPPVSQESNGWDTAPVLQESNGCDVVPVSEELLKEDPTRSSLVSNDHDVTSSQVTHGLKIAVSAATQQSTAWATPASIKREEDPIPSSPMRRRRWEITPASIKREDPFQSSPMRRRRWETTPTSRVETGRDMGSSSQSSQVQSAPPTSEGDAGLDDAGSAQKVGTSWDKDTSAMPGMEPGMQTVHQADHIASTMMDAANLHGTNVSKSHQSSPTASDSSKMVEDITMQMESVVQMTWPSLSEGRKWNRRQKEVSSATAVPPASTTSNAEIGSASEAVIVAEIAREIVPAQHSIPPSATNIVPLEFWTRTAEPSPIPVPVPIPVLVPFLKFTVAIRRLHIVDETNYFGNRMCKAILLRPHHSHTHTPTLLDALRRLGQKLCMKLECAPIVLCQDVPSEDWPIMERAKPGRNEWVTHWRQCHLPRLFEHACWFVAPLAEFPTLATEEAEELAMEYERERAARGLDDEWQQQQPLQEVDLSFLDEDW